MYFSAVESISTSNLGREFYVGFLDNLGSSGTTALYIAAFEPTNVKIYSQMSGFTTISFFITTGDVKYIPFPPTFMTINSASYNTYYIQADKGISVIGLNSEEYTSDGFLAFPVDIPAPTSFRLITYSANSFGSNMGIVASDDNTEITISYSPNAGVSSPTSITLNRMQGYQIQASGDLTGTSITSTKPISVYSGNRCANVPLNAFACDNIVEQMMPIATWGTEYNTVSIPTRTSFDVFRAVANEDSTSIYIDGVLQTTIDAGSFYEFQVPSGNYDVISSDKIISLAQFCVGTSTDNVISDPFMTIIPPSAQYISRYFFTTPIGGTAFANYLSIVIESDYSSGLLFDESPLTATWNTIGSGSYVGTSLSITPGAHSLTHTSATVQFSVQLAGFGSAESYGYPGGIRLAPIALPCIQTTTVIDDGIDNDCDGKIDEELPNGVDDDGDGLIDEDLVSPNCEDGNICTTDFFDGTQCTSTPLDCSDGNPCTTDTCDESSGCQHTPIADGGSCILDDLCYTGSCQSGTCAKTPITCDDNNPCTSNSCDSSVGCVFSAISGGECTDNNVCTEYDTCDEGVCVGTQISCGEDTQCLKYRCDATTGCYSTFGFGACQINACEFGRCNSGVCDYVGSVNCDDNNPCTDDTCDDESGCNNLYNNENTCYSEQCNQVTTCHYGECTSKSIEVDRDCDFVPECLDQCKGVDDRVDNDHDGNIDCLSPPTEYNHIYPAWKCNIDRAYVCSVIKTQSKCISWSDVASYVESGDYLFGKCYSACRSNS